MKEKKVTALHFAGLAAGVLMCMVFAGDGNVSQASQIFVPLETKKDNSPDFENEDSLDVSDYEGDVTEDELDRALEEYIRQMDMNTLIKDEGTAGKVTDPVLKMEPEEGRFKYTLPNGNFFSSVPGGMITSDTVDMELPEGTIGMVSLNDEGEKFAGSWHFSKQGSYHVRLLMYQQPGVMTTDYNLYEVNFYFTIVGKKDNTLGVFSAPQGFAIKEIRQDGNRLNIDDERCYFLGEDGYYEIRCESREWEGIFADAVFIRDTMAPFLSFSGEMELEGITGPVEIYPSEPDCQIFINYNGNHGYAAGSVLTAAGNYELSVKDDAGNERVYHFRIRQTYSLIDRRIIVAGIMVLVLGAVRFAALRRNMRIL